MSGRAIIVVDLGFGDSGKGTIVDALVRDESASLVVRYNGGAQAGHNVVTTDGRHHTFSQLGSGTFVPGVATHLAPAVVVHPSALLVECRHLARRGIGDALARLTIAPGCPITTPFHQAAGRLRELNRGDGPHGTCGVGVGETVRDGLGHPADRLLAAHLGQPDAELGARLERIRRRLGAELADDLGSRATDDRVAPELALLEDPRVTDRWLEQIAPLRQRKGLVDETRAQQACRRDEGTIILEGAQGVLLDEDWGFHPHTTWSRCTSAGAQRWLDDMDFVGARTRLGVLRTLVTRHGPGPLPSGTDGLAQLAEPHNGVEGWQGAFRRGWPDPILWRYALTANAGVDALAVTHLDELSRQSPWLAVRSYGAGGAGILEQLARCAGSSPAALRQRAALGRQLLAVEPQLGPIPVPPGASPQQAFVDWIAEALTVPVVMTSTGPTAAEKAYLRSLAER